MASKFRQEMPPVGGYDPVDWAKKFKPRGLSGAKMFGILGAVTVAAWTGYYFERRLKMAQRLETYDGRLAVEPLLLAEQHRLFLRQLRKNRDEENELMKDVPGWETGTWMGEKVYHNFAGRFIEVDGHEYYAHCKPYAYEKRFLEKLRL